MLRSSRTRMAFVKTKKFQNLQERLQQSVDGGSMHPKLAKLEEIVLNHFTDSGVLAHCGSFTDFTSKTMLKKLV